METFEPKCQVGLCADDPDNAGPAELLLPQVDGDRYRWLLVCEAHADCWWYDGDHPRLSTWYALTPVGI
jgi:hypothetical protein